MKTILKTAMWLSSALLLAGSAWADSDGQGGSTAGGGVLSTVENAVKRGANAAAHGIERGAQAAGQGIDTGMKAAARGVTRGAEATERVAGRVVGQGGGASAPSSD